MSNNFHNFYENMLISNMQTKKSVCLWVQNNKNWESDPHTYIFMENVSAFCIASRGAVPTSPLLPVKGPQYRIFCNSGV